MEAALMGNCRVSRRVACERPVLVDARQIVDVGIGPVGELDASSVDA